MSKSRWVIRYKNGRKGVWDCTQHRWAMKPKSNPQIAADKINKLYTKRREKEASK